MPVGGSSVASPLSLGPGGQDGWITACFLTGPGPGLRGPLNTMPQATRHVATPALACFLNPYSPLPANVRERQVERTTGTSA